MTRLLGSVDAIVRPHRAMIVIAGPAAGFVPIARPSHGLVVQAATDLLYLFSGSDRPHEAEVVLQAWDGPPPADARAELTQRTTVELTDGTVHVSRMLEGPASATLTVGRPGLHDVSVLVTGRAELHRRDDDPDRPDDLRAERFVVRLSPAR